MKKPLFSTLLLCICGISLLFFPSCSDEPGEVVEKERLVLIYAIAANNGLQSALGGDMSEILAAGPRLDLNKNLVLVYAVDNSNECKLYRLVKNNKTNTCDYVIEKTFPELPLSTSPERISEVLDYVGKNYNYPAKGLVLWSHGTGWIPSENGSTPKEDKRKTFGRDKYDNVNYETDINLLAEAIPEGMYDFIWFDCCYMGNIETVFQLRDKTDHVIGYTEEIASAGMPYNLTMPYLLQKNADLKGAARALYDYYDALSTSVTVSIVDTKYLDELAQAAKDIFSIGTAPADLSDIQNYTRGEFKSKGIFYYDMGQLLESYGNIPEAVLSRLQNALNASVVYKLVANYSWPGPLVNPEHYSGLSMHHYIDNNSEKEEFYRELDWYKATR